MRAMFVLLLGAGCGHDYECLDAFFVDADGDGHGAPGESIRRCSTPPGYAASNDDCDDADPTVHTDADEICNDRDEDCDGSVDEDAVDASLWYTDADADGFGEAGGAVSACTQPAGTVTDATDCDDAADAIHPGAQEICNALDDDCDDLTDDADPDLTDGDAFFLDADGDGYGVDTNVVEACVAPAGYLLESGDCDDAAPTVFPGATEDCANGVDDDCDTRIDECLPSIDAADVFLTGTSGPIGYVGYRIETGDLNADGVADLIAAANATAEAQVYVASGPMWSDRTTDEADVAFRNDSTGFLAFDSMASADADGDGYDDILISSYGSVHGYLFRGPLTGDAVVADADLELTGNGAFPVVQILGDHDGDGSPDIAARTMDYSLIRRGTIYVDSGTETGSVDLPANATYTYGNWQNDEVGFSIVSLGDATGDGIDDLAIGDPGRENHSVYVLGGGADPGSYSLRGAPIARVSSTMSSDRFGETIAATDYNSDGYVDMLIGAPKHPNVRAFFGPFAGERDANEADVEWTGVRSIGYAIAADGDVDADGQPDVLFGAPYANDWGAAYLQLGAASGVVDVSELVVFTSDSMYLGEGVAFVPDWTGDGGSEIAIGDICFEPVEGEMSGRVGVFFSEAF